MKYSKEQEYILERFGSRDELIKRLLDELKLNFSLSTITEPQIDFSKLSEKQIREIKKVIAREKVKMLLHILGQ